MRFAGGRNGLASPLMGLPRRTLLLAAGAASLPARAAEPVRLVCPLQAEPDCLIPGLSDRLETRLIGSKLYGGLCRFDARGVPQPDIAAGWEVSADGLVYVFHLRPGLVWHDSGAVTADDVVFSIDRFHRCLQPRLGLDRVTAVRAPDPQTVVITLAAPFEPFLRQLDALSAPIVPQHVHDRPGFAVDPRAVLPIGTGPFWMGERWRLTRFDWFAGPKPALAEIACPVLTDLAARPALLERRNILLVGDPAELAALPGIGHMPALAIDSQPANAMAGLRLNAGSPPLGDRRVRSGLACAIDRAALLRDVWSGQGRAATGPALSASLGRDAAALLPAYDPRQASSDFTAAGLLPDDRGVRLRLSHLVPPGALWHRLAARLRLMLDHVGVDLVPEAVSEAEWTRRVAAGDYQVTGFHSLQSGDLSLDLAAYQAEVPEVAPMLADRLAEAAAVLVAAMTRVWLVEPALAVLRDRRLSLPGGVFSDFAAARLSCAPDRSSL